MKKFINIGCFFFLFSADALCINTISYRGKNYTYLKSSEKMIASTNHPPRNTCGAACRTREIYSGQKMKKKTTGQSTGG